MKKVYSDAASALAGVVRDGQTIAVGGFGLCGIPEALIAALRDSGVQLLTLGQYLRPSAQHLPVVEYVHPDSFKLYERIAYDKGFEFVASGPLVRSSYHAADYDPRTRHGLK